MAGRPPPKLAVIDPEDIARVAVAALTEGGHVGKGYFRTGPEALTWREQVEIIAEVTRRSIDFEDVSPHEFAQAAIQRGTPPEEAHLIERLNEGLRAGRARSVGGQPHQPDATQAPSAPIADQATARVTARVVTGATRPFVARS